MNNSHHPLDYIEISVTDLARAREFYGQAFGWRFNDYGPDYAGIQAAEGDSEVGGLALGRAAGPGGVVALLRSDDLDASVAAVEAAGGKVVEGPFDVVGAEQRECSTTLS